jgi:hypothetical protein
MSRLRHSALPKLAACPRFEGSPATSPEASRGTLMDAAFRAALTQDFKMVVLDCQDDADAVGWAVDKARELAGDHALEAREEFLRMHTPGIEHVGTADVLCVGGGWVGDLKTGQMRSYLEQMAAYCLACMAREFADAWTAHVIYADARQVASYRFTWDEAKRVVDGIIAEVRDKHARPRGCEYCGWCRHKDRCTARLDDANGALTVIDETALSLPELRERIMADPDRLSAFLRQWKLAEKEIAEPVFEEAKRRMEADPDCVPGWKLTSVSGREYFDHMAIVKAATDAGCGLNELVLSLGGKMGGKKFREWCGDLGVAVDESLARKGEPTTQLRAVSAKKSK